MEPLISFEILAKSFLVALSHVPDGALRTDLYIKEEIMCVSRNTAQCAVWT
jgi:hypothetical protein